LWRRSRPWRGRSRAEALRARGRGGQWVSVVPRPSGERAKSGWGEHPVADAPAGEAAAMDAHVALLGGGEDHLPALGGVDPLDDAARAAGIELGKYVVEQDHALP